MALELKIEKSGATWDVELGGVIDEDADFAPYALTGAPGVTLKLSKVKSINSCGIREWIKWIGTAGGAAVTYVDCPKVIVDQINMVQGFLPPQGQVSSFFVPYFAEESGEEKAVIFSLGKEYTSDGEVSPPMIKDSTGQEMEMDVIEAKYFKFLKRA